MKKMNKKGFTIVELVIVIAVIAILAGVLIPTFSGIVTKANESKVLQEARNEFTKIYTEDLEDGIVNGKKDANTNVTKDAKVTTYAFDDGAVTSYVYTEDKITVTYTASGNTWVVTTVD